MVDKIKDFFKQVAEYGDHSESKKKYEYDDIDSLNEALLNGMIDLDSFVDNQQYLINRDSVRRMEMEPPGQPHEHI